MLTLLSSKNQTISSLQDWLTYSPPAKKEAQWKDGRSAKELAKAWLRSGQPQVPAELSALLQAHPATAGVKANPNSRVPDRISQLSQALFGSQDVTHLRYQLLHATAGTLIEASARQADRALLIIHEFVPFTGKTSKAKQNKRDLQDFVPGACVGPFEVPGGGRIPSDIPLCLGKIETFLAD